MGCRGVEMASFRIFVSHSSKDNALTRDVVASLQKPGAGGRNVEVLVDIDKLEDGVLWPSQLHDMMADCHAGLLLLTPQAVASPWVLKEATILTWRGSLEPSFRVFVVQFPDVDAAALTAAKFDPLQHRQVQAVPTIDPAEIAQRIHASVSANAAAPGKTWFERLSDRLAEVLDSNAIGDQLLGEIVDKLGTQAPPWRPGGRARAGLVEAVASQILRGQMGQYTGLSALMNELRASRLPRESLRLILRWAAPHWVDPQSAALFSNLVDEPLGPEPCRAAAMNGRHASRYTGKMFVNRAFPLAFEHQVYGAKRPSAGDDLAHYTREICAFCRREDERRDDKLYDFNDDEPIVDKLKNEDPWLFVVLPPPPPDDALINDLRARFPRVRFVLATGPTLLESQLPEHVLRLRPSIDVDVEQAKYQDYEKAQRVLT